MQFDIFWDDSKTLVIYFGGHFVHFDVIKFVAFLFLIVFQIF